MRIVVPFLPGGSIDVVARLLAKELSLDLGQQFVVENRAGAGGTIGADQVAKAGPDGHTLLFTAQGPLVINPFLMPVAYDAQSAFAPVSLVVEAPNVLVASPNSGFRSFEGFLERARGGPDALSYGTQGVGTTGHITGSLLEQVLRVPLTHIPYNGFPPVLTDVLSDRVNLMIADTVNVGERVKSTDLKALAVASRERSTVLPDVPTFAELGYPDIVAGPWFALLAPAGTAPQVRERLAEKTREIVARPAVAEAFGRMGLQTVGSTPDELGDYMREEYTRWGEVIRKADIPSSR